jgi:hypothetical protein
VEVGRLDTGIVGSNRAQGIVCPRLCVLCSPLEADALRRADTLSKGVLPNVGTEP